MLSVGHLRRIQDIKMPRFVVFLGFFLVVLHMKVLYSTMYSEICIHVADVLYIQEVGISACAYKNDLQGRSIFLCVCIFLVLMSHLILVSRT